MITHGKRLDVTGEGFMPRLSFISQNRYCYCSVRLVIIAANVFTTRSALNNILYSVLLVVYISVYSVLVYI